MWISRKKYNEIISRIEDLEKSTMMAAYVDNYYPSAGSYSDSEYRVRINDLIGMLFEHLGIYYKKPGLTKATLIKKENNNEE